MKVIKRGRLPEEEWVGAKGTCNHCHTMIEVENAFEVTTAYSQRDGDYSYVVCPVCKRNIYVVKPRPEQDLIH